MTLKFSFIVLVLCLHQITALENLCSNDVFENKCLCKKFTDEVTNLPTSLANCNGIGLVKFPNFSSLPNDLTVLELSMNNIAMLELSNSNTTSLKKLVLSYNGITSVKKDFFNGLSSLSILDLSHNNLSSLSDDDDNDGNVFLQLKNLLYIDLSYNNFKQLPPAIFDPVKRLQFLDLSYNPLGEFLTSSKDVLSKTLGINQNISHLKLNNDSIKDFHPDYFSPYTQLKHLELQDNHFDYIPSMPYSLEYLDFSGNNLTFVSARYLNYHSLKTLRLSRMPSLVSVHHYAFYNLQALESLILTDCPNLEEFTDLAFGLASKTMDIHPQKLILARNGIRSLNSTYKHMFRKMNHIDLRHNPWNCDCGLLWLQSFGVELFKGREIRCATPINLKRKRVMDLTHLDLQECYPEVYGKTSHRVTIIILMTTVIFLMGLIFYLVRYPRSWVNPRQIGIGPTSPYVQAPQEDVRF